ncbi:VOC family protein [Olivibacter ginsenosidimutans]|uniref:VOC family protein n=1 Tax=Olivibacter ginsenosidimutans TaxID=1176537 RepID=A0ABP9AVT5_9SPHI
MLNKSKAFSGFSVDHLEKAKAFYSNTLGLTIRDNPMGVLELHLLGNNPLIIYPKSNHSPATYTVLNFPVANIEETVDALTAKGVTFLSYTGDLQTNERGIHNAEGQLKGPKIAWFTDPAGNILSILEE